MIGESDERTLQELARRFQRTLAADREALSPSYGRIGSIAWNPVRVLRRDEKGIVILCRYFGQPTRQQLLGVKTNRRGDAGFSSRAKPGPGHRLMAQSFRDVPTQTNDFTLRRTSEISDFWYCLLSRPGLGQLKCQLTCTAQTQYHAMV